MNSPLPSKPEAWARLEAAAPPAWVLRHVACVERLAIAMARQARSRGLAVDEDLVAVGAALHDIGRSITQDPSHAYLGACLLREEGWPEVVVRIVERHTGAGLWPDDAVAIGIPEGRYVPETLEERIVAHADNLYSGDKRLALELVRAKYEAKGLHDAWLRIEAMHDRLREELGVDPETVATSAS